MSLSSALARVGVGADRAGAGNEHAARLRAIMEAWTAMSLAYHIESVDYNGRYAPQRSQIEDIWRSGPPEERATGIYYPFGCSSRVLPRVLRSAEQLAAGLNVASVSVEREGSTVYVCIPRPADDIPVVRFHDIWKEPLPPGHLLLGVGDGEMVYVVNLVKSGPHALGTGQTNSGKSGLLRSMAYSALLSGGAEVALISPVVDEADDVFEALQGHSNVWCRRAFRTPEDGEWALRSLVDLMEAGPQADGRLLLVFVDEAGELVARRPNTKELLGRLARAGRHAGIHLIMGTQTPLAEELGRDAMANVNIRLVGKVADAQVAYWCAGMGGTGAERLPGRGAFLYVSGGKVVPFQAAWLAEEDLAEIRAAWPFDPALAITPWEPGTPLPELEARTTSQMGRTGTPEAVPPPAATTPPPAGGVNEEQVVRWIMRRVTDTRNSEYEPPALRAISRYVQMRWPANGEMRRDRARRLTNEAYARLTAYGLGRPLPYPEGEE